VRRILLVVVVFSGCALQPKPPDVAPLVWSDCGSAFDCAAVPVPVDHERPDGPRISLAVIRRAAEKPAERIGVLFVNPGGPGISATASLRFTAARYGAVVRERFDLVAFDTRGTGGSAPLDCHASLDALFAQDPTPESDAAWNAVVEASRAFSEECVRAHGDLLPFMGTDESARDLDLVRAALGESQISYLGFSYGTALGAVYATRYPDRVRAMVLDGAIEPSFDLLVFAREQSAAVESAFLAYDEAAARKGWHGTDVLEAVTARAERKPIPSHSPAKDAKIRPARASDILYGSVEAVTSPDYGWHELASALGAAQAGNGAAFVELSDQYFQREPDGTSALVVEAQLAVLCADLHRPVSVEVWREALPSLAESSPHVGVANLLSLLPCATWPAPARPLEPPKLANASQILILAGSRDPLTPGVWGVRLSEALRGSARIDVETNGHTAYARDDACTDRIVEHLLVSLEPPQSPSRCPSATPKP
jgi:pimeloyl-ACP methyl ester carboxylesterase